MNRRELTSAPVKSPIFGVDAPISAWYNGLWELCYERDRNTPDQQCVGKYLEDLLDYLTAVTYFRSASESDMDLDDSLRELCSAIIDKGHPSLLLDRKISSDHNKDDGYFDENDRLDDFFAKACLRGLNESFENQPRKLHHYRYADKAMQSVDTEWFIRYPTQMNPRPQYLIGGFDALKYNILDAIGHVRQAIITSTLSCISIEHDANDQYVIKESDSSDDTLYDAVIILPSGVDRDDRGSIAASAVFLSEIMDIVSDRCAYYKAVFLGNGQEDMQMAKSIVAASKADFIVNMTSEEKLDFCDDAVWVQTDGYTSVGVISDYQGPLSKKALDICRKRKAWWELKTLRSSIEQFYKANPSVPNSEMEVNQQQLVKTLSFGSVDLSAPFYIMNRENTDMQMYLQDIEDLVEDRVGDEIWTGCESTVEYFVFAMTILYDSYLFNMLRNAEWSSKDRERAEAELPNYDREFETAVEAVNAVAEDARALGLKTAIDAVVKKRVRLSDVLL